MRRSLWCCGLAQSLAEALVDAWRSSVEVSLRGRSNRRDVRWLRVTAITRADPPGEVVAAVLGSPDALRVLAASPSLPAPGTTIHDGILLACDKLGELAIYGGRCAASDPWPVLLDLALRHPEHPTFPDALRALLLRECRAPRPQGREQWRRLVEMADEPMRDQLFEASLEFTAQWNHCPLKELWGVLWGAVEGDGAQRGRWLDRIVDRIQEIEYSNNLNILFDINLTDDILARLPNDDAIVTERHPALEQMQMDGFTYAWTPAA